MSCVEFRSVSTSLGGNLVLSDVTLALPAGRTTAIVGASGSGKSTLLNHVNGLLHPDAGEVRVFGEKVPVDRPAAFRRRMGYAVQGVGLFPHLTAVANISLLARLSAWTEQRIDARVDELLALFGLTREQVQRYPHELSGGQQQRVGLCRAMMLSPALLLLDEPFSGVDPITRRDIHDEFIRLRDAAPPTVMLVTHDIAEALRLGDFLVFVSAGRIVQADDKSAVLQAPADASIERLLDGYRP